MKTEIQTLLILITKKKTGSDFFVVAWGFVLLGFFCLFFVFVFLSTMDNNVQANKKELWILMIIGYIILTFYNFPLNSWLNTRVFVNANWRKGDISLFLQVLSRLIFFLKRNNACKTLNQVKQFKILRLTTVTPEFL